jgi:hypothetical protein
VVLQDTDIAFISDVGKFMISNGSQTQEIGEPTRYLIKNSTKVDDAYGWSEDRDNSSYLCWTFPTLSKTIYYDTRDKSWSEREEYSVSVGNRLKVSTYSYWAPLNYHVFGHSVTGIFRYDTTTRQDPSGEPVVATRVTGYMDHGSSGWKRSNGLRVTLKRGVATLGTTPGLLEVRCQDDHGPWSDYDQISLGEPHDYEQVVWAYISGIFRRRRYEFRYTGTDKMALIEAFDDVYELENG